MTLASYRLGLVGSLTPIRHQTSIEASLLEVVWQNRARELVELAIRNMQLFVQPHPTAKAIQNTANSGRL
jgi:hypothetical protein